MKLRAKLPIVLMGGIKDGVDAVKAIALGATAVGLGTSMLIAAVVLPVCSAASAVALAALQRRTLTT